MLTFERDLRIIFNCFILIGMPSFGENEYKLRAQTTAKRFLYKLCENVMTVFGFYSMMAAYFYMPTDNIYSSLIAVIVNLLITTLRLSFICKKGQILRVVNEMKAFMKFTLKSYKPTKKHVLLVCISSTVLPMVAHVCLIYFLVKHYDCYREELDRFLIEKPDSMLLTTFIIMLLQSSFLFHFYLIPCVCMILISYIYFVYGEMYEQALLEVTQDLSSSFQAADVKKSVETLGQLYQIHEELENVLSLSTCNAYGLSLMNFFNVVSVTKYYKKKAGVEFNVYCALIFAWTLLWVVFLIIAGSKLATAGSLKSTLRRKLVLDFLHAKKNGKKSEFYLLMVLDCLKPDIHFTTWGLLKIERELLLTTFGFIVTYSALIITL